MSAQQLPALEPDKMKIVQELEIEMMTDMYARLTKACHKKCIPPKYREAELQKGESVCIDRCVAKYLEVHERIGKKLTEISTKDQQFQERAMGISQ
uniref:Mitochondrial import inner membrane translocase subunit n=1 Tax=Caligus rogercresseyi TaxID=217165 RepID=C1BRK1_CALRO|nr:Mitochondrial import inner membrane translocase subunit Tim10 [Caligus rogercresseyi]